MQLAECIDGPSFANEESGEGVAVPSPVGGIGSGLVIPEVVAAGCAAAGTTDFAEE